MATETGADDIVVVDPDDRHPGSVIVAVLTHIAGLNVRRALARGRGAVMTAGAIGRGAGVIEIRRHPGVCRMADLAIVAALNVSRVLAGCCAAVVAAETGADHIVVVDLGHRHPGGVAVAVFAHIGTHDMCCALACSRCAVMTDRTVVRGTGVIEIGRYPASAGVAGLAVVTARNVRGVFTGRRGAVMAAETGADHVVVVDPDDRNPGGVAMAILAQIVG